MDAVLLAQIFHKFQSHVTLCLPGEKIDAFPPLERQLRSKLEDSGVEILENSIITNASFKKSEGDVCDIECSVSSANCVESIKCNGVVTLTYQVSV